MVKYKDVPNYKYSIKNIEKRIKFLERAKNKDSINDIVFECNKKFVKNLKANLIEGEANFQRFFLSLAGISLSEKYKYNILECLNTLKGIFKENDIDSLSSFVYIHNIFIRYDTDVSVILKTITNIIEANKNNKIFLSNINQHIMAEQYNILLDEKLMLETLHSSLIEEKEQMKDKARQEAVNNIIAKYYEDFKQICK